MKKGLLLGFILIVLALVSSSLVFVNLVLIFSLLLFLFGNERFGGYSFFFGGFILDLLGTNSFGYFTLILTSLLVAGSLIKRLLKASLILKVFIAFVSTTAFFAITSSTKNVSFFQTLNYLLVNAFFFLLLFPFVSFVNEFFKGDLLSRNR